MRRVAITLAALVLANVALWSLRARASAERAELVDEAATLTQRAVDDRRESERRQALDALIAEASTHAADPRDIGGLRDVLIDAERDLLLDRLSLDFRPEEQLPRAIGGTRVHASLRGRFDALYDYLNRIEQTFVPLSLESLDLRGEPDSVTLTVQWGARWPLAGADAPVELSEAEMVSLDQWYSRTPRPPIPRNVFAFNEGDVPTPAPISSARVAEEPHEELEHDNEPERPVLTGFVLARPELEPDVRRRVLAALRYDGETRLVMVGDTIAGYVVEKMEARDSVTLTHRATGESLFLTLQ